MKKVEEYKALRAERDSLASRLTGYSSQMQKLRESIEPLEEQAIRLEILRDPGHAEKRKEVGASRGKIDQLAAELEGDKRRLKITNEILSTMKDEVRMEMIAHCQKEFGKKAEPLVKKLKECLKMELELDQFREKLEAEFREADISSYLAPNLKWEPVLMSARGRPSLPNIIEKLRSFINTSFGSEVL